MTEPGKLKLEDLEPVGPGTPAGRYLRHFWHPVMRVRDLPPGRAKPLEILGEKFTIYRGEDGSPHILDYRCPHRGTPLSLGWVEGGALRCRYHGWKFDCTGQCTEQPNEDRPFSEKIRARSYPAEEYLGLIFAYFGTGDPPPLPRYPDLDRPGVIVADPPETLPCTFWNKLDNDTNHVPWVHRATALRTGRNDFLQIRPETGEETPYGWRGIRCLPGEISQPGVSLGLNSIHHWFMPVLRLFFVPTRAKGFEGSGLWDTKAAWTVPVNDTTHTAFDVTNTPIEGEAAEAYAEARYGQQEEEAVDRWELAEKVLAGGMTLEDLPADIGAYTSFTIEDYTTQVGQGPVRGRGVENLAPSDVKPLHLRRIWLREVSALLAGKPLTRWRLPETPLSQLAAQDGET